MSDFVCDNLALPERATCGRCARPEVQIGAWMYDLGNNWTAVYPTPICSDCLTAEERTVLECFRSRHAEAVA